MTTAKDAAITYFDRLPRENLPSLQSAYDKVRTGKFNKGSIYKALCKDFAEIGQDHPPIELFNVWIADVERGEIERPERAISGGDRMQQLKKAKTAVESRHHAVPSSEKKASLPVADANLVQPVQVDARLVAEPPIVALKNAVIRLADELYAQMQANARQSSREQAASILRDVAAELEAAE